MATVHVASCPVAKKAKPAAAPKPKKVKAPAMVWPTCVRHSAPAKDTRFRYFFLCDDCCAKWTAEAFSGNAPLHTSEPVNGFCLLCNQVKAVRMRTWFLCEVCNRVAASIGRNHVAELALEAFWKQHVQSRLPHLKLTRNDIAALRPRRRTDERATAPTRSSRWICSASRTRLAAVPSRK
jgi:hypothetical protein